MSGERKGVADMIAVSFVVNEALAQAKDDVAREEVYYIGQPCQCYGCEYRVEQVQKGKPRPAFAILGHGELPLWKDVG